MARRLRKTRADNQRWGQMIDSLRLINFAFNNIKLYPPTHTEVMGVIQKLHETIQPIFEDQDDLGFGFMDELLYIEGSMSIEETANNQMLVDRFTRCRVKYLTIMKTVTVEDLSTFFQLMNGEAVKPSTEHPGELLTEKGIETIHIVEAEVDDVASKSKAKRKKTLLDWYDKAIGVLRVTQDELRDKPDADLKPLYRLIDDMMATMRNKGAGPYLLLPNMATGRDPHLAHSVNVGVLCCVLGDLYGLNTGQINTLCAMGFLHDLGRLTIPPEWAADHTPLTAEEKAIARQHGDWGFLLLLRNPEISPQMALMAAHHHDPSLMEFAPDAGAAQGGYRPDSYHKIVAVADAYDLAMISDRYYWKKHRKDRMLAHLLNKRGVLFDSNIIKLLAAGVGYYPLGALVRLEDGRRGLVVRTNPANVSRPKLFMFDEDWVPPEPVEGEKPPEPIPEEDYPPVILDLAEFVQDATAFKNSIASVIAPSGELNVEKIIASKQDFILSHAI